MSLYNRIPSLIRVAASSCKPSTQQLAQTTISALAGTFSSTSATMVAMQSTPTATNSSYKNQSQGSNRTAIALFGTAAAAATYSSSQNSTAECQGGRTGGRGGGWKGGGGRGWNGNLPQNHHYGPQDGKNGNRIAGYNGGYSSRGGNFSSFDSSSGNGMNGSRGMNNRRHPPPQPPSHYGPSSFDTNSYNHYSQRSLSQPNHYGPPSRLNTVHPPPHPTHQGHTSGMMMNQNALPPQQGHGMNSPLITVSHLILHLAFVIDHLLTLNFYSFILEPYLDDEILLETEDELKKQAKRNNDRQAQPQKKHRTVDDYGGPHSRDTHTLVPAALRPHKTTAKIWACFDKFDEDEHQELKGLLKCTKCDEEFRAVEMPGGTLGLTRLCRRHAGTCQKAYRQEGYNFQQADDNKPPGFVAPPEHYTSNRWNEFFFSEKDVDVDDPASFKRATHVYCKHCKQKFKMLGTQKGVPGHTCVVESDSEVDDDGEF